MAGLALLSAAPLLSATVSVTFTICEDTFIRPMIYRNADKGAVATNTETNLRQSVNIILPSQSRWVRRGLVIVFTSYPLSIATAIANVARHDAHIDLLGNGRSRAAAGLYLAGLLFSILHFPFGPKAMRHLKRVRENKGIDGDPKADNTAAMESWLGINAIRGIVADVPSWICYFTGFLLAMS